MLWFRPLPPLPNLEISENTVVRVSDALRVLINHTLSVARDIAVGRNIKVFLQVPLPFRFFFQHIILVFIRWMLSLFFFFFVFFFFCLFLIWCRVNLQVAFGLWVASYIGSLFNFLTLVYIGLLFTSNTSLTPQLLDPICSLIYFWIDFAGVLLSLSVPVLYDKYQDHIDDKLCVTHRIIQTQYRRIDENILRKIPMASYKEKKLQ